MWLWGREPDAAEQTRLISALREACPQATAGTARRFLIARDWSLDKATKMLGKHIEWNESEQAAVVGKLGLTSQRAASREGLSEEVVGILASNRFRLLVGGAEPVILVDFLWGKFMEGVSVDALMAAYLVFLAEVLGNADALREPGSPAKVKSILVGGSPPMAYVRLTHPVFEANFPERLGTSAIYPVPWVIKVIVDASTRQSPASVHPDPSLGHLLHLPGAVRGRSKGSSTREYAPHSERIPDSPTPSALWEAPHLLPISCRYLVAPAGSCRCRSIAC